MNAMKIGLSLILLTATVMPQSNSARIGDDYARAALRAVIFTTQSGITVEHISALLNEADVEATTPAEEASLREVNRIVGVWITHPSNDRQPCYLALKAYLKARNGNTPEACK